jgi:hypothetical protein
MEPGPISTVALAVHPATPAADAAERPRTWQELPLLDVRIARERALRCAIQTGRLADMNLIHAIQRSAGHEPCFGRAGEPCPETRCRWYEPCMVLTEFAPLSPAARPTVRFCAEPADHPATDESAPPIEAWSAPSWPRR